MNNTTYYKKNREIILNRAKDYHENDKERLKEQAKNKYKTYQKKKKLKKANMEKTDNIICLKKRNKN